MKRELAHPHTLARIPLVIERLKASASGYVRTTRIGRKDRGALAVLIEEGEAEIFDSPSGRAYRLRKKEKA